MSHLEMYAEGGLMRSIKKGIHSERSAELTGGIELRSAGDRKDNR